MPIYQKGVSYYTAVPHGFTALALHTPATRGNATIRSLMRKVDFYIMRQTWVLKAVQAWAAAAATVVSVAISVAASTAITATKEAILGRGKGAVAFLKDLVGTLREEITEELILEPIFGEWFYTAHSMAKGGGGRKRGTLASGVEVNAQSAIQEWEGAVAKFV